MKYAERSYGGYRGGGRIVQDNLLLRGRITRGSIEGLIYGPDLAKKCFGYALLGGLHDATPSDANFSEEWLDVQGNPVITVSVSYNKTYATKSERKK